VITIAQSVCVFFNNADHNVEPPYLKDSTSPNASVVITHAMALHGVSDSVKSLLIMGI